MEIDKKAIEMLAVASHMEVCRIKLFSLKHLIINEQERARKYAQLRDEYYKAEAELDELRRQCAHE